MIIFYAPVFFLVSDGWTKLMNRWVSKMKRLKGEIAALSQKWNEMMAESSRCLSMTTKQRPAPKAHGDVRSGKFTARHGERKRWGRDIKPREWGKASCLVTEAGGEKGARRWRKERKRGGGGEEWSCFQVQRVPGHDAASAAAIPPTALSRLTRRTKERLRPSVFPCCMFWKDLWYFFSHN